MASMPLITVSYLERQGLLERDTGNTYLTPEAHMLFLDGVYSADKSRVRFRGNQARTSTII